MKKLSEVAEMANEIYAQHEEIADIDAGFDGGEFSGPAHDRMAEREVEQMAQKEGYTLDQVADEMMRQANQYQEQFFGV